MRDIIDAKASSFGSIYSVLMARMHTGKHGKSKSRKPDVESGTRPEGLTLSDEQIVKLIVELREAGNAPGADRPER